MTGIKVLILEMAWTRWKGLERMGRDSREVEESVVVVDMREVVACA